MVALCPYLLIGFWSPRPAAAAAAKKAFLVTRLGDLGFLLAILLIFAQGGTFDIAAIQELAIAGALGSSTLTFFALGVFAGAAGKSAQVPLHVWLPDAMGGLRRALPITFATFVIASLSLSGIFPFAGFWSKDEILSDAWAHERYLFYIALATAGVTAFYVFRAVFLTFGGEYRGGGEPEVGAQHAAPSSAHDAHGGPHEAPPGMTRPLLGPPLPAPP